MSRLLHVTLFMVGMAAVVGGGLCISSPGLAVSSVASRGPVQADDQPPPWHQPDWHRPDWHQPKPSAEPAADASAALPDEEAGAKLFGHDVAWEGTTDLRGGSLLAEAPLVLRSDGFRAVFVDNDASPPRVHLFAPYPGGELRERGYIMGHLSPVLAVALSSDFRLLATVSGAGSDEAGDEVDRSLRLWNAEAMNRRTPALALSHGDPSALAISPDGKLIAVGDVDGYVTVFRNRHGRQRGRSLRAHEGPVSALVFLSNGERLMTASGPDNPQPFALWRPRPLAGRGRVDLPAPTSRVSTLAVLPDGDILVGETGGALWRAALGSEEIRWRTTLKGAVRRVRFVPGQGAGVAFVAAAGRPEPVVLDLATGARRPSIPSRHRAGLVDLAYDASTGLVVLAHVDGTVEIWRVSGAADPKQYR